MNDPDEPISRKHNFCYIEKFEREVIEMCKSNSYRQVLRFLNKVRGS